MRTITTTAPTAVSQHCRAINALVDKLANAERKVDEYQRAIGQHIAAIKKARPKDWQKVIEVECKLKRSRAYELLAIGDGTKTVEDTRANRAERNRKKRAKDKSVRLGTEKSTALVKAEPTGSLTPSWRRESTENQNAVGRKPEHVRRVPGQTERHASADL